MRTFQEDILPHISFESHDTKTDMRDQSPLLHITENDPWGPLSYGDHTQRNSPPAQSTTPISAANLETFMGSYQGIDMTDLGFLNTLTGPLSVSPDSEGADQQYRPHGILLDSNLQSSLQLGLLSAADLESSSHSAPPASSLFDRNDDSVVPPSGLWEWNLSEDSSGAGSLTSSDDMDEWSRIIEVAAMNGNLDLEQGSCCRSTPSLGFPTTLVHDALGPEMSLADPHFSAISSCSTFASPASPSRTSGQASSSLVDCSPLEGLNAALSSIAAPWMTSTPTLLDDQHAGQCFSMAGNNTMAFEVDSFGFQMPLNSGFSSQFATDANELIGLNFNNDNSGLYGSGVYSPWGNEPARALPISWPPLMTPLYPQSHQIHPVGEEHSSATAALPIFTSIGYPQERWVHCETTVASSQENFGNQLPHEQGWQWDHPLPWNSTSFWPLPQQAGISDAPERPVRHPYPSFQLGTQPLGLQIHPTKPPPPGYPTPTFPIVSIPAFDQHLRPLPCFSLSRSSSPRPMQPPLLPPPPPQLPPSTASPRLSTLPFPPPLRPFGYPSHIGPNFSLKRRRRLNAEETEFLVDQFRKNEKPTALEREGFAERLGLDRRTIQVWFQNRRAKLKRDDGAPGKYWRVPDDGEEGETVAGEEEEEEEETMEGGEGRDEEEDEGMMMMMVDRGWNQDAWRQEMEGWLRSKTEGC